MMLLWILLAWTSALPDLYIYVENNPDTQSQHVLDALQTPLDTLRDRHPCSETDKHLRWLQDERHTLREAAQIIIRHRDEEDFNVPSYAHLPGYSFSPRELPALLHPQVYLHWPAVCKHLTYLTKISEYGKQENSTRSYVLGLNLRESHRWFGIAYNLEEVSIPWRSQTILMTERTLRAYLIFEPYPPIDQGPMPYQISRSWVGKEGDLELLHTEDEKFKVDEVHFQKILEAADMGTGIIFHPEATPEPPEELEP